MRDERFETLRQTGHSRALAPADEVEAARFEGRRIALGNADASLLDHVVRTFDHSHALPEVWRAFDAGFVGTLREQSSQSAPWIATLQAEIRRSASAPAELLLGSPSSDTYLESAARAWAVETSPLAALNADAVHLSVRGEKPFFELSLLLMLDPIEWCQAIDALPFPALMHLAFQFFSHINEDRELICTVLRAAPAMLDSDANWLPSRSVTALLSINLALTHARSLHETVAHAARMAAEVAPSTDGPSEADLRELENNELPAWLREAFAVLLTRPDGRPLAITLLAHLSRKVLLGSGRHWQRGWWMEEQALHILADVLRQTGSGVDSIRPAWAVAERNGKHRSSAAPRAGRRARSNSKWPADRGEGRPSLESEGMPFLFAAAVILGDDPNDTSQLESFRSWFEELLLARDPGLSLVRHGSMASVPQRFGFLLSRIGDAHTRVRDAYTRLEPQRRRTMFSHRYEDSSDDLGSVLLLRVGFFLCANLAKADRRAPAIDLFWWLYDAARRLWLTAYHDFDETRQSLVSIAYAFMKDLFESELPSALRRALASVSNDPRLVAEAGWYLWRNGVAPADLAALLREAGADLEEALRDAHQWAQLTEEHLPHRGSDPSRGFPPALQDLAQAVGVSLDINAATLDPDASRHRTRLARSVPWAEAFLERLGRDGCVLARLDPLDADANAWFFQASTSERLQERFGLSASIRGLIVSGQVRGRELRLVQQDPLDAESVDPDFLLVASDQPGLVHRLPSLAGPWGQRVGLTPAAGSFAPIVGEFEAQMPGFDLFDHRDPVRGRALIGREAEVVDLTTRLLRGESVGLFGLRKVGKSSLLRAVAERLDPIGARRGMFETLTVPLPQADSQLLVVSLDVQAVAGRDLSVLLDRLSATIEDRLTHTDRRAGRPQLSGDWARAGAEIAMPIEQGRSIGRALWSEGTDAMDRFQSLVRSALEATGLGLCFMLDEYDLLFEGYGGEPGVPGVERLLAFLRSESNATGRVSLALAGRDASFVDAPLQGGFTNPLAGWTRHSYLGPLPRKPHDELLTRLGKRTGLHVGPMSLDAAWGWTGGHPLLTRQYGAELLEEAETNSDGLMPVATDPIHGAADMAFMGREAVQTICAEVLALLGVRYPLALDLMRRFADEMIVLSENPLLHDSGSAQQRGILRHFGLLSSDERGEWVPRVFREGLRLSLGPADGGQE